MTTLTAGVSRTPSLADGVIRKLPIGYDRMIGKRLQNLVNLSGGEGRTAIARAYIHEAPVLIPDKSTAALDACAKYEVFQSFRELSAGKSAVRISHRFSSVCMAARILVLVDDGVALKMTTAMLNRLTHHCDIVEMAAQEAPLAGDHRP